eukprot:jgi/Undpi1/2781/HiC_scaffold_14.g06158.m1
MAKLLPACRCSRFYRALLLPLLLVVLLVGQSRVVLGDAVAAAGGEGQRTVAVDALGEMEVVDSLPLKDVQQQEDDDVASSGGGAESVPENTPEEPSDNADEQQQQQQQQQCVDVSSIEQQREELRVKLAAAEDRLQGLLEESKAQQLKHASEIDTCGGSREDLEEKLGGVLEMVGGEEGIQELVSAAAAAKEAAAKEGAAAAKEKEEASLRAEKMVRGGGRGRREDRNDTAGKHGLQSELSAAQTELLELRSMLTDAEARESEAREDAGKHAKDKEEVGRLLERTASELKMAQTPRKVSVMAIMADVRQLVDELVSQSKDARDDIMARASEQGEKVAVKLAEAKAMAEPYVKTASDKATPLVLKAVEVTAPYRAQAGEAYATHKGTFDEKVGNPVAEKWLIAKAQGMEAFSLAMAKWEEAETALLQKLVYAGVSEEKAQKTCKYVYMGLMAFAVVVLLFYLGKPVLGCIVLPLIRTALRLVLWAVLLPFRILFLPVRLVFWILSSLFRLAFGRGGKGTGKPAAAPVAKSGTSGSKKGKAKR